MENDYNHEISFAFRLFKTNSNIGKYNILLQEAKKTAGTTEGAEILIIRTMTPLFVEFKKKNGGDELLELHTVDWLLDEIKKRLPSRQEQSYPKPSSVKGDEVDKIIKQICNTEFHRASEGDSQTLRQMASYVSDEPDKLIRQIVEEILQRPGAHTLEYRTIGSLVNIELRDQVKEWDKKQWER